MYKEFDGDCMDGLLQDSQVQRVGRNLTYWWIAGACCTFSLHTKVCLRSVMIDFSLHNKLCSTAAGDFHNSTIDFVADRFWLHHTQSILSDQLLLPIDKFEHSFPSYPGIPVTLSIASIVVGQLQIWMVFLTPWTFYPDNQYSCNPTICQLGSRIFPRPHILCFELQSLKMSRCWLANIWIEVQASSWNVMLTHSWRQCLSRDHTCTNYPFIYSWRKNLSNK